MTLRLSVQGYDFGGAPQADKDKATSIFKDALLEQVGGSVEVLKAAYDTYRAQQEAGNSEDIAVRRWEEMEAAAVHAAFNEWMRQPSGVHFELNFWEMKRPKANAAARGFTLANRKRK